MKTPELKVGMYVKIKPGGTKPDYLIGQRAGPYKIVEIWSHSVIIITNPDGRAPWGSAYTSRGALVWAEHFEPDRFFEAVKRAIENAEAQD